MFDVCSMSHKPWPVGGRDSYTVILWKVLAKTTDWDLNLFPFSIQSFGIQIFVSIFVAGSEV